ncbi:hypothetical protein GCM10010435_74200 [Winogradskya consettensis]|uniref:Uncharacterized protein n=1 Tax=Winogradskya consettensis TaxID=113560 RepID=A0A919SMY8_9ACTN|nr:hypothetical protein [Actinoplanes consettensis]GIM75050.1 hypothetical protein Aco04nite_43380 [Actinoplanes consettensis]
MVHDPVPEQAQMLEVPMHVTSRPPKAGPEDAKERRSPQGYLIRPAQQRNPEAECHRRHDIVGGGLTLQRSAQAGDGLINRPSAKARERDHIPPVGPAVAFRQSVMKGVPHRDLQAVQRRIESRRGLDVPPIEAQDFRPVARAVSEVGLKARFRQEFSHPALIIFRHGHVRLFR